LDPGDNNVYCCACTRILSFYCCAVTLYPAWDFNQAYYQKPPQQTTQVRTRVWDSGKRLFH
jgi:hypothetical protein